MGILKDLFKKKKDEKVEEKSEKKKTSSVAAKDSSKKEVKKTSATKKTETKKKTFAKKTTTKTVKKVTKKGVENEKISLIIDSDVANEIDDQFAISYVLSRQDVFDLNAITIAPFRVTWQKLDIRGGMIDSKNEAERILRLFGVKYSQKDPMVYFGCENFLSNGYHGKNDAVNKIIEVAKKNEMTTICCIGTLTNVALALKTAPRIAAKIKIVWLGTDNVMLDHFEDTNYTKDIEAFNRVIASDVDFTIFPTYLARSFVTSQYEFERNAKGNSITRYLAQLIGKFQFSEENMGIKTIYDIGPVAYLLHEKEFSKKVISPEILLKDKKFKYDADRKVTYITAVPKHQFVWTDFMKAINSNDEHFAKSYLFFTSDTHFDDENKVRKNLVPFKTVKEMNDEIVRRWNSRVAPNDIVYHMGDFGNYEFVKKLNGNIILICGNYEEKDYRKDFPSFRQKLIDMGFKDVIKDGLYLEKEVLGERVYLTHKPSNHAKDCKTIFGHVHDLSMVKSFGFNVCTTYHYFTPVGVGTVKRYLQFIGSENLDNDVTID